MRQEWALNIKRQREQQKAVFFFKQWCGWGADGKKRAKKHNGRLLQGRTWDAVPGVFVEKGASCVEEIKSEIDRFVSYFRKQFDIIGAASFTGNGNLYKKMLFVGLIDALSKSIYPRKGNNRERFVSFVRNFCDWKLCEKISLPHLIRLLEKSPDPEFSKLRGFAFTCADKWREGDEIPIHNDPDFQEVQKYWPKDKEYSKPLENVQLEYLRHIHLLYTYRNSLIHELRKPGYGMEHDNDKEPYYHSMTHIADEEITSWELVYPLEFFKSISGAALKNLERYYLDNRINPYNSFTFGSYWLEELNR